MMPIVDNILRYTSRSHRGQLRPILTSSRTEFSRYQIEQWCAPIPSRSYLEFWAKSVRFFESMEDHTLVRIDLSGRFWQWQSITRHLCKYQRLCGVRPGVKGCALAYAGLFLVRWLNLDGGREPMGVAFQSLCNLRGTLCHTHTLGSATVVICSPWLLVRAMTTRFQLCSLDQTRREQACGFRCHPCSFRNICCRCQLIRRVAD